MQRDACNILSIIARLQVLKVLGSVGPGRFGEPKRMLTPAPASRLHFSFGTLSVSSPHFHGFIYIYTYTSRRKQPSSTRPGIISRSKLFPESRHCCHALVALVIDEENLSSPNAKAGRWGLGGRRCSLFGCVNSTIRVPSSARAEARYRGQRPHGRSLAYVTFASSLWSHSAWVRILVLLLPLCVPLKQLRSLPVPQFPPL